MTEEPRKKKFNLYITIVLAVVIIAAIGIYVYTTFIPKESPESDDNTPPIVDPEHNLLTISFESQIYNYTLDDLTALANISGQASYINSVGTISPLTTYTGIPISALLNSIPSLPPNYTFKAIASEEDDNRTYSMDEVNGHVKLYNESGNEIGFGKRNLTMIIVYKQNDVLLNETTNGPLRIGFIDIEPTITKSGLWWSHLTEIRINES